MHLTVEHYLLALRDELPIEALAHQSSLHLSEVCPFCSAEANHSRHVLSPTLDNGSRESPSFDPRCISRRVVTAAKGHLSLLRSIATDAREDLRRLLRLPQDKWLHRVTSARTRMRSRAFAEQLIAESMERVRTDPTAAAALSDLVPYALQWTQGRTDLPWLAPLLARAAAHHANALRVAGDLVAADDLFRSLVSPRVGGGAMDCAELASLEASLRIDQRRFDEATELLRAAVGAYELSANPIGVARTLIKCANLAGTLGQTEEVLPILTRAANQISSAANPLLFLATVSGRVNALCDLDRGAEAESLLTEYQDLYLNEDDDYKRAFFVLLSGRVALANGRLDEAGSLLVDARDRLLALDRDYDAILTALYLAGALLAAGKTSELKRLAVGLVPLFRARDVERETLAALCLLAQAAKAEGVTAAVLAEVRDKLCSPPRVSARVPRL